MKKITFFIGVFLFTAFSYSQSFPLDFSDSLDVFSGNNGSSSVIVVDPAGCSTDGCSGDVLQINGAGDQFGDPVSLDLTRYVDLSDSANNTITLEFYAASSGNLLVQFSNGAQEGSENGLPVEINAPVVAGLNSLVLDYDTADNGFPNCQGCPTPLPVTLDKYATISLFVDFGVANLSQVHFVDNIAGGLDGGDILPTCTDGVQNGLETGVDCGGPDCGPCPVPPSTAAPNAPARDPNDVISIFSGEYSNVSVSGINVFAGASLDNFTIDVADDTRRLTAPTPGGGAQYEFFGASPALDLTDFTHMHVDFYVEGDVAPGQLFQVFLLDFPNYPAGDGAQNINTSFDVNASGSGAWISGDVALDDFANSAAARNQVALVQIVAAGPSAFGPIYFDNLYFYKLNDDCDNAEVIDSIDFGATLSGTNVGATDSGLSDGCVTGNDVWYSFTAAQDGEVNVTLDAGFEYAFYSDCMGTLVGSCNASLTAATTGTTYYLRIGDDGSPSTRASGTFNFSISGSALSTNDFSNLGSLKVYPNPSNSIWNIESPNTVIEQVEVYDLLGKNVLSLQPESQNVEIDATQLKTGLYLAKFSANGTTKTIRLVKN
ncbi:putative secreted protein (Por secretion system target) [Winogradskyella wandonensis]|uniref:Putative secreted protein (Por secretion system target) n=1 Tax=Winogradskyella wandonensis TaxID=1442586 RepID=A0A4R1KSD6_9FLAO|nr:T9SS type A sorting domain-containing protein [Winogradskyella wandonensis]TCK67503.1 putative secreted protein (Por secretion system target) [Winogradskyella wandonensis]